MHRLGLLSKSMCRTRNAHLSHPKYSSSGSLILELKPTFRLTKAYCSPYGYFKHTNWKSGTHTVVCEIQTLSLSLLHPYTSRSIDLGLDSVHQVTIRETQREGLCSLFKQSVEEFRWRTRTQSTNNDWNYCCEFHYC